jgi:beta propeller repeat protein
VYGCAYARRTGSCAAVSVSHDALASMPPTSASGHIAWLEQQGDDVALRACRPDRHGAGCRPADIGVEPGRIALLGSDGKRLTWTDFGAGQRFGTCRLGRRTGACAAIRTLQTFSIWSRGTSSDGRLAWVGFDPRGSNPLQICQLDDETGECNPIWITEGVTDVTPDLSGNRLVWDAQVGDESSDVFFCEHDAVRDRCPVQRLTSHMGVQAESSIDGDRIVWEDDREGPWRIYAARLPRLGPIADRRVREGQRLWVPVRSSRSGPGQHLHLEAERVAGGTLDELGARFVDFGNGRGALSWRPARGMAGHYAVTFTATTAERIVTRHTMRIEVLESRRPRPGRPAWW